MKNICIQIDGTAITHDILTEYQIQKLYELGLIKKIQINNFPVFKLSFVGCIEVDEIILISLPYGVTKLQLEKLPKKSFHNLIKSLIKSIRFFSHHYLNNNEFVLSGKLAASFYLLEDFENNGILTKHIKYNAEKDRGSINWGKTIKKNTPFKSGSSWIYTNFIRRHNINHDENELTLIHKWAVKEAINMLSIISDDFPSIPDDFETQLTNDDVKEIALRLYPKITKDREIHVVELILQLVNESSNFELSAIYTKNFNLIWESALQKVLEHSHELKNKIPKVRWNDIAITTKELEMHSLIKGVSPEVDIIFQAGTDLHILDAKYYDLFNTGSRPGLTDMWKQFYYGQAYKVILESEETPKNGFIFPCFILQPEIFIKKFSSVEFFVPISNGDQNKLTEIPAYVASLQIVLDSFIYSQSLQNKYLNEI